MMQQNNRINPTLSLSPLQAHYLKKELISRQIKSEIQLLSHYGALKNLGPPFTNDDDDGAKTVTPFLRFIFSRFVRTFPILQKADETFWPKLSEFLNEFAKKNITSSATRNESTKRKKLSEKIVNELTLLLNAGIKTTFGMEESIKVDFSSIYENLNYKASEELPLSINGWNVNIASVRASSEKTRIRERVCTQYIIQTIRQNQNSDESIFVAKRYKDFKKLYNKLKTEFAAIDIPSIPNKLKVRSKSHVALNDDKSNYLYRSEKNRQNLRAYLRSLLSIREVARSEMMYHFLTESPISLNENEKKDAKERQELDSIRDNQLKRFNDEAEKRTKELEHHVSEFKKEIMGSGGLSKVIHTIQQTPNISDLPKTYQKIIECGEIGFASTLYSLFIGSDNSSVNFAQLKRTHSLMPYKTLRTIMKISNPIALMRGILDLFLAQPFGQKSLAQRILSMNLNESLKELDKDIKILEDEINDDEICQKLRNFVYASNEIQTNIKNEAKEGDIDDFMLVILHTENLTPVLKHSQVARFTGVINNIKIDNTELIRDLKKLFFFYARYRDREMMIDLLFQGITSELLKEIITIFYEPLAKVYKAANISDSLSDLSVFVDDLINVVEEVDRKGIIMYSSAESVVQMFVSLVHRHIPEFYSFVHSVYSHDSTNLFSSLLGWIESLLDFMQRGLTEQVDLQKLIDTELTTEEERALVIIELDNLMSWHTWRKKRHLMRLKNIMYNDIDKRSDSTSVGESEEDDDDDDYDDDDDLVGIAEEDDDLQPDSSSDLTVDKKMEFPELKVIPKLLPPFVNLISNFMFLNNIEH